METTEVFDAVKKTYSKKDHHSKPHAHMEVEVSDGFI
jgi:hypothetical protein